MMDSDDLLKEHISDEQIEEKWCLSDYVLEMLHLTNECRIWIKLRNTEEAVNQLHNLDSLLVEMRYGEWEFENPSSP